MKKIYINNKVKKNTPLFFSFIRIKTSRYKIITPSDTIRPEHFLVHENLRIIYLHSNNLPVICR